MLDDRPITVPRLGLKGFPSEVFSCTEGSDLFPPFSSQVWAKALCEDVTTGLNSDPSCLIEDQTGDIPPQSAPRGAADAVREEGVDSPRVV